VSNSPISTSANQGLAIGHFTRVGNPKPNLANTKQAITLLGVSVSRDEFRDHIVLGGGSLPPAYQGRLVDRAITWLRHQILDNYGFDPGDDHVYSAIKGLAEDGRVNPVTDYLASLTWDGQQRLSTWLPRITGAEANELNSMSGTMLIMAMVIRAFFPGTKYDICVVLEGRQGCGKSSLVTALSGRDFFTDVPALLAQDAKQRGELLQGIWVAELAELSGLNRTDVEYVKALLSQTHDHFRAAYEKVAVRRPRTCIFVGTTNSSEYLIDTTGNRRFITIKCGPRIDLKAFLLEREQLFAEARVGVQRLLAKRPAVLGQPLASGIALPAHLWPAAKAANENRRLVEHGEEILVELLKTRLADPRLRRQPNGAPFVSTLELLPELRLQLGHNPSSKALTGWMAALGWERARHGRAADQIRGYEKLS